jgi:hypothetical protein
MKANYRKVPPYMTKAGVQIGLLYQEPFEDRMDKDGYALQRALLSQKYKTVNKPYLVIDVVIVALSVVALIGIVIGVLYGIL